MEIIASLCNKKNQIYLINLRKYKYTDKDFQQFILSHK